MPENPAMTFDEVSMERSKSFINALQELKNLRPQLYSAAEYCEKSYLHSEQKQMVLDNLKDYAVRALVNAVDHLGTVAYKLNDLFEQEVSDVSTVGLKISCLNQQLLTCQTYMDKEGLRQQKLVTIIPRHHKHYVLPNSVNKKVQFNPQPPTDFRQKHIQAKLRPHPSETPASKTLSWHLASETKSASNGTLQASQGKGDHGASGPTSEVFHLLESGEAISSTPALNHRHPSSGGPASSAILRTLGATRMVMSTKTTQDSSEGTKALLAFRSFDTPGLREGSRPPVRSKSMLSAFFAKNKSAKPKSSIL